MKPIYNRREWVLCYCVECGRLNYVEPHGTTAECKCSPTWTEHQNIPYEMRNSMGTMYTGPARLTALAQARKESK